VARAGRLAGSCRAARRGQARQPTPLLSFTPHAYTRPGAKEYSKNIPGRPAAIVDYSLRIPLPGVCGAEPWPIDATMKPSIHRQVWSSVVQALLGSAAVLLLTHGGYRLQIDLTAATFLCLIVVLLVSLGGYFIPAAFVSVVALLCVNYFFIPPLFSIWVAHPIDEIAVIAFLATGVVISRLVARLRQSFGEVQALNERLQLVVDTIPTQVSRTRPDGSVDYINQRWQEYLGLTLEEVKDWGWTTIVHPDDRERFVDQWRAALSSGEPLESEIRIRRSDGGVSLDLESRGPLARCAGQDRQLVFSERRPRGKEAGGGAGPAGRPGVSHRHRHDSRVALEYVP
jgi:PAS domain S-box-containing protein